MKFRKVEFKNHPILGNAAFDFTDAGGQTVDTIILAGENGCGKSYLLNFLNNYNPGLSVANDGYNVRVEIEFSMDELKGFWSNPDFEREMRSSFSGNTVTFIHEQGRPGGTAFVKYKDKNGVVIEKYAYLFMLDMRAYKSIFSDVEINFSPSEIRHISSSNIDKEFVHSERSSVNLATEIKQLLVDIDNLDNSELAQWVDRHKGQAPPDNVLHRRVRRFTEAFDLIFESKRFKCIDNNGSSKRVMFEENGKQMEISQLSSGEKQIVFRGGFLLRNLGTMSGAPVLVDEPELSLHPKWQQKILAFIKTLFTNSEGKQTSQVIVATHSPFIVHNNTRSEDKVIVMQKDPKGGTVILDKPEYYNWTEAVTIEDAFNIRPFLFDDKINILLEGETDEMYFDRALDVFGFDRNVISIKWIGRNVEKGKAENTGCKALNSAYSFLVANPQFLLSSKVYLLYDCDTNKPDIQDGNLYVGAMAFNANAEKYKIGVENLLTLPDGFDYEKYYTETVETDNYGGRKKISSLNKMLLAKDLTAMSGDELKSIFANIKAEIEKVLNRVK